MPNQSWISCWFLLSSAITFWDAGYCLMRPRSMEGGDLHWLWKPYTLYGQMDYVYSVESYEKGEGFASAGAVMAVVENLTAYTYLYLVHVANSDLAPLIGYSAAIMTMAKTVVHVGQELFCGLCGIGHNDVSTMISYWVLPKALWFTVSWLIMFSLGKDIYSSLRNSKLKTQ
ncbi:hypothetical protein K435DRAFT_776233 [Dendrothele bispora CBS 962.96]|uniref:EXPERA domain-containing protein n=1 Tax=Dendrothele bispora (strain CBS 962.96) TaxID=1314807 RepID=A0A4S8MEL5_DENBC|nr:hypothetical protein K435DRAFT_776233 [Dendrothele bispora CBS 962.96]